MICCEREVVVSDRFGQVHAFKKEVLSHGGKNITVLNHYENGKMKYMVSSWQFKNTYGVKAFSRMKKKKIRNFL